MEKEKIAANAAQPNVNNTVKLPLNLLYPIIDSNNNKFIIKKMCITRFKLVAETFYG